MGDRTRRLPAGAALALAALACGGAVGDKPIAPGTKVSLEFSMSLEDGTVVDTNVGKEPLHFEVGTGAVLPALELALQGLRAGEEKHLVLYPEQAYGMPHPEAFESVPLERIPEDHRVPDAVVEGEGPGGERRRFRVHEVREDAVVLDTNHPLAGRTLTFDVKILSVE
jgi:FKBP-type peptidyl-prolyl cis-trans isomerase 2